MTNTDVCGLLIIGIISSISGILVHFMINKLLGNYDD